MSRRTKRHDLFLKFLYSADASQKKELVGVATEEQLKAFREIAMNLYLGQPPVSAYYKTKLKVYKHLLQSLADRRVDNTDVKKLLKRQPEAITLILKPHWKDGRRIRTRQEDDARSDETSTE